MMTKDKILKFTQDPDFQEFRDMFEDYLKPILSVSSIDLTQPATMIKAEIVVRKQTHERLRRFMDEMELLKIAAGNTPVSYK
jgi:hypothetical protein